MGEQLENTPAGYKSVTTAFVAVIGLTFIASLLVANLLVSPSVDRAIATLQKSNSHAEASLSAKLLEQHIQDRVQVLLDIAKYPVIKNAVMETGISQADLNDFLNHTTLLGNAEDLAVLNISANPLYERHETPKMYNPEAPWFVSLLDGTSDKEINLISTKTHNFIQIAVPVKLGGYPEGVLVSEIKLDLDALFSNLLSTSNRKIVLSKHGVDISTRQDTDINDSVIITEHLAYSNIDLHYFLSAPQLNKEKRNTIIKIMLSVLLSMAVAFIILYITGKKTLLNPYKKLHESQAELKESQARFQLAVEGSNDGIWEWNLQKNNFYFSPRLRELLGYAGDDLTNLPNDWSTWRKQYHPDDFKAGYQALQDHIEKSTPYDLEFRLRHKDGSYRFFRSRGTAQRNDKGEAVRMAGSLTDITARIIQQRDLEKSRLEAENANQAKSEFLASMSHEIRTPMNGVIGMLSILERSELDRDQQRQLNMAKLSANSLLNIINDILDFSKIDARKLSLESIEFNLIKMLGDFADGMGLRIAEKNLELVLDLRGISATFVKGDPSRIRQILTNLVGNAIKFTEQGEITVQATLEPSADSRWRLRCSVKDTGIGISKDQQEKLFDPFTQADSSTTRKYGGTGLGLTICKHLSELMGGSISVNSNAEAGSEFQFDLLLDQSNRQQLAMPSIVPSDAKILVVDDNISNCEVLCSQLQLWGANIIQAHSAEQAMELLHAALPEQAFNLALLDLQMPDMDGVELAKKIRENTNFQHLKLVLMTSYTQPGDARRFATYGIQAYFPKPVTINDLLSAIAILVENGEAVKAAHPLLTKHYVNEFSIAIERAEELRNLAVLVVEDNQINQEVIRMVLEDFGIQPEFAQHGKAALNRLQDQSVDKPFNLILMDCQMPIMDGFTATRAIRQGEAGDNNRTLPIVAMTANAMEGDRERCLAAGMNDYLSKPIDTALLARSLLRWAKGVENEILETKNTHAAHSNGSVLWDKAAALKRVRGRHDRLATLLTMFQKSAPEVLTALQQAIHSGDRKKILAQAHALKGTSGNLAFMHVYQACITLEEKCETATQRELQIQLDQLKSAHEKIQ